MNRFVEECRREWRRLRVPEAIANEMAADLAADLAEAEAEGASAEDVLGDAVFDPRAFAASWAAERGVVAPPTVDAGRWSTPFLVAGAVLLVVAFLGAALVIAGSGSTETRLAIAAPHGPVAFFRPRIIGPAFGHLSRRQVFVKPAFIGPPPKFFVGGQHDDMTRAGLALLVVGLLGTAVVAGLGVRARRRIEACSPRRISLDG